MDLGIAGKWALVGGASKGLGWGCARALALEGVNVVMVARGAEVLNKAVDDLRDETGGKVKLIALAQDITTSAGREAIWNVAGGPGKDYDIVVTNAGGPPPGDFRDWDREAWIKATVDGMAARGFGRIVNITSSAVKAPIDVLGLSNGARSGLTGFVAGASRSKIAGQGVTINNLLPGKFDTDRIRATLPAMAQKQGKTVEEMRAIQQAQIPAGRYGNPQEFGAICAFLCSQHAAYMTGQNVLADGGAYAGTF